MGTRMAFTARYGASLRRNDTTCGAFHLLNSSWVGCEGLYGVWGIEYGAVRERSRPELVMSGMPRRGSGVMAGGGARGAGVGAGPPPRPATNPAAFEQGALGTLSRDTLEAPGLH